jgi:UDP-N-acetylglucosamine 1-carboxyvinyltransferase
LLCAEATNGLRGAEIELPIRSTGATANAIICGALASGTTRIWNPHIRPEILDLVALLRKMGAIIEVHGQEKICVDGLASGLNGTVHDVIPDNMEAITWVIAATMTGGDLTIHNFPSSHLEVPLIHLRESGTKFFAGTEGMIVRGGRCYPVEISTGPFPGINSDMQPLFAAYGALAHGESRIVDLRFPGRFGYAEEFGKLGVDCCVRDNQLIVQGGSRLRGAEVTALDLRAGVALSLLGLVADGATIVRDAWQVERGYSRFVDRLQSLGADIKYLDAS